MELSLNKALPWSLELIERFEDRWDWGGDGLLGPGLSANEALPWSFELIERYEDRWDWEDLSGNEALPWSLELIERYEASMELERYRGRGTAYLETMPCPGPLN